MPFITWTCSKCYYPCLGVHELLDHIDNNHTQVKIKKCDNILDDKNKN